MRTRESIRNELTDVQAFTCTLIGEALNEPLDGVLAVASTIRNRVNADIHGDSKPDWWGETYKGVCLKPWQFSCWWELNANAARVYDAATALLDGADWTTQHEAFIHIASLVMEGDVPDISNRADHYLTTALYRSSKCPAWAKLSTPVCVAGHHTFFHLGAW